MPGRTEAARLSSEIAVRVHGELQGNTKAAGILLAAPTLFIFRLSKRHSEPAFPLTLK